jgi:hypothetical protein
MTNNYLKITHPSRPIEVIFFDDTSKEDTSEALLKARSFQGRQSLVIAWRGHCTPRHRSVSGHKVDAIVMVPEHVLARERTMDIADRSKKSN